MKRILTLVAISAVTVAIVLSTVGCEKRTNNTAVKMCAIEEVEIKKSSKGKVIGYELDYINGDEVKITQAQYNFYQGRETAPCGRP